MKKKSLSNDKNEVVWCEGESARFLVLWEECNKCIKNGYKQRTSLKTSNTFSLKEKVFPVCFLLLQKQNWISFSFEEKEKKEAKTMHKIFSKYFQIESLELFGFLFSIFIFPELN